MRFANLIFIILKKLVHQYKDLDKDELAEIMQGAVMAIPLHHCDHFDATYEDRLVYHCFCTADFCKFMEETEEGKKDYKPKKIGEFYVQEQNKKLENCSDAMMKIIKCFEGFAKLDVMKKLTRWLSQNTNESIHNRLFHIINKTKFVHFNHVFFAASLTAVIHNNGYESAIGNFHSHMGVYYEEEQRHLKQLDKSRKRHSEKRQQDHKKKSRYQGKPPLIPSEVNYCAGFGFEDYDIEGLEEFEANLERATNLDKDLQRDDEELGLI